MEVNTETCFIQFETQIENNDFDDKSLCSELVEEENDPFAQFNKNEEKRNAELLEETENKLYRYYEKGEVEDLVEGKTFSRRSLLEKRHNFESNNRPQSNHSALTFSEWNSHFKFLRIKGTRMQMNENETDKESLIVGKKEEEEIILSLGEMEIELNRNEEKEKQMKEQMIMKQIQEEIVLETWKRIVPKLIPIFNNIVLSSNARNIPRNPSLAGSAIHLRLQRTKKEKESRKRRNPRSRFHTKTLDTQASSTS